MRLKVSRGRQCSSNHRSRRWRAARLSPRHPHPAPAKLGLRLAKPAHPSPARGEGELAWCSFEQCVHQTRDDSFGQHQIRPVAGRMGGVDYRSSRRHCRRPAVRRVAGLRLFPGAWWHDRLPPAVARSARLSRLGLGRARDPRLRVCRAANRAGPGDAGAGVDRPGRHGAPWAAACRREVPVLAAGDSACGLRAWPRVPGGAVGLAGADRGAGAADRNAARPAGPARSLGAAASPPAWC